eukprot:8277377-Pyramimonas_sp.AAC.1
MYTCGTRSLTTISPRASRHCSNVQTMRCVRPVSTTRAVCKAVASLRSSVPRPRHMGSTTLAKPLRTQRRSVAMPAAVIDGTESEMDEEAVQALNEVCNRAIKVMLQNDAEAAEELDDELEEQRRAIVEYEQDYECARFLAVVQGFLNHLVLEEVSNLTGVYEKVRNLFLR